MLRPNILFAIADDASHFGCYGHSFVRTPHADRVAREGVRFNRMFTTNPKCAPSRASLLTGMHTWQLKEACTHFCYFPGPDEFDVYPDVLEEAGYHVGFTGKGWGPGNFERQGRVRNPAGNEYNARTLTPPADTGIQPRDYAANFADFLADRSADEPFCFWYGAHEPHRHYVQGEAVAHGKTLDEVRSVPPYWPDDEVVRGDFLDYAFEIEWFDSQLGKMLELLEEVGELGNTLVIVTSDNGCPFPRVKGQMYDDDFRLPFVAMWQDRVAGGRVVDDLCSFVDLMPTLLEVGGVGTFPQLPGRSLTDILYAEGEGTVNPERDRAFMGRERHDLGREGDKGYPVRCLRTPEYLYIHNYAPDRWPAGNPETGYTNCDSSPTKRRILDLHESGTSSYFWELAFGKRPAEELYYLPDDPHCLTNLASQENQQVRLAGFRAELEQVLAETGDPRQQGEGDIFDSYEYLNAEKARHSWRAYQEGRYQVPPF